MAATGDVRYQGMLWLACSFLVILFLDSIQEVTLLQKIVLVVWCFLGKVYLHDLNAVAVTPAKSPYPLHSPRRRSSQKGPSKQQVKASPIAAPMPLSMSKSVSLGSLNTLNPPPDDHPTTIKRSQTSSSLTPLNPEPMSMLEHLQEPFSPRTDSETGSSPKSDGDFLVGDDDASRLDTFKSMLNLADSVGLPYTDEYLLSVMDVPGRALQYAADKLNRIIAWRNEYKAHTITPDEVASQFQNCSMYWFGYDFHNRPILWLRPKKKDYANMDNDLEIRANVYILELAIKRFMPPGVTCFTLILDCKDVGYREVDISLTKNLVQVTTGNYPDRIGCIGVGPLTMLVKTLTRIFSPLLPPRLRDKARFMDNPLATLSEVMPLDVIPTFMGGTNPHFLNADDEAGRFDYDFMVSEMQRRMRAIVMTGEPTPPL
ncbi:hypothetical protein H257_05882 [Aphanomyces astaci]|uniref:CRAL-TRIO domain-containing protein n=2 Tax=Aphanomyces astaci TaxID=112090 RepID=W4GNP3_APHAT|nr:hypothetical protein H257_05882 [Aphanomyces astaci]ETV81335.1 hypothetical protein H257_05882 [Aphanomyces astaci]|eukprot:XP_009829193.1 hypothetical protein H257_05882 [Aphanomyces astaci]